MRTLDRVKFDYPIYALATRGGGWVNHYFLSRERALKFIERQQLRQYDSTFLWVYDTFWDRWQTTQVYEVTGFREIEQILFSERDDVDVVQRYPVPRLPYVEPRSTP